MVEEARLHGLRRGCERLGCGARLLTHSPIPQHRLISRLQLACLDPPHRWPSHQRNRRHEGSSRGAAPLWAAGGCRQGAAGVASLTPTHTLHRRDFPHCINLAVSHLPLPPHAVGADQGGPPGGAGHPSRRPGGRRWRWPPAFCACEDFQGCRRCWGEHWGSRCCGVADAAAGFQHAAQVSSFKVAGGVGASGGGSRCCGGCACRARAYAVHGFAGVLRRDRCRRRRRLLPSSPPTACRQGPRQL